jgi:tetratricopeptide (TPR) repeat protein
LKGYRISLREIIVKLKGTTNVSSLPNNRESILKKSRELRNKFKDKKAIKCLVRYLKRHPTDLEALTLLAGDYYYAHKRRRSIETAQRVLDIQPDSLDGLLIMAKNHVDQENPSSAIQFTRRGLDLYENSPGAKSQVPPRYEETLRRTHWRALRDLGDLEEALEVAQKGFAKDPLDWMLGLVGTLLMLDRFEEAEKVRASFSKSHPSALWDIGVMLFYYGKYEAASSYLLHRLSYARLPPEFDLLQTYMESLALAGKHKELISLGEFWMASKSIKRRSQKDVLVALLAVGYHGLGDYASAKNYARRFLRERSIDSRCTFLLREGLFEDTVSLICSALIVINSQPTVT